jgi:hypothetical protein
VADHRARPSGGRAARSTSASHTVRPSRAATAATSTTRKTSRAKPAHAAAKTKTKPKAKPAARRRPAQPTGPTGRLGVVWAVVTVALLLLGPVVLAGWMAAHAALAGVQAARSHRRSNRQRSGPHLIAAAAAAGVIPVACVLGLPGLAAGVVVAVAAAVVLPSVLPQGTTDTVGTVTALVPFGAAAGSLVLARDLGAVPALFLLLLMCAYDTGNYLIGTGADHAWEGSAAGIAAMVPITIGAATIAVPPFTETGPFILGGVAMVLAPLGPWAATRLLGDSTKGRVPAVRRLDALVLLGPVWAVAATALKS